MSEVRLSTADVIELFEMLQLVNDWISTDPIAQRRLSGFINDSDWAPDTFVADLDRFVFLLGGSNGEYLLRDKDSG
ncbi:hypothetical protein [Nocardia sp. SYP-A9097]|uniref:hypothetical protein n=1 Tax=Nocardia sp. SYP-A9097 TaxID=2663237 RepID=UPI001891CE0C|nr:hypothetical protein [Nocardia sp. SYP-A9097]